MFRTLLTPLSAHFSFSPSSPRQDSAGSRSNELSPEEFARDVLIEIMRNSVERLKVAEGLQVNIEALTEIHRILSEDSCTKDVFREVDGFLVVLKILSTTQPTNPADQILEATQLVFAIMSEALYEHKQNTAYFKTSVRYESLSQAMMSLVQERKTAQQTLGFLVSFALHNFAMSGIFNYAPGTDYMGLDRNIHDFEPAFGLLHHPEAFLVLYNFLPVISASDPALRYSIYKLLERVSHHNHRNHCVLNSLGLVDSLFQRYCGSRNDSDMPKPERQVVQKLLRKLVDVGTTTDEARVMFQRAVRADDTLDPDVLEILRAGMKVRWPEHLSLESPALLRVSGDNMRGMPQAGFTFMIWMWVEKFPVRKAHPLFSCTLGGRRHVGLSLRPDGALDCESSTANGTVVFKATIIKSRWTHLALVHYPHRGSNPTLRLFVDGALADSVNWPYPKVGTIPAVYAIGDNSETVAMSWSIASAYLIAAPLPDDLLRFVHHLGPRYVARFQATDLVKFLTYEGSTALNIYLSGASQQHDAKHLMHAIRDGMGIAESAVLFAVNPESQVEYSDGRELPGITYDGDVFVARSSCLDLAMWEIGGAAVALRLVQLANNQHEVSRALGILTDGVRNSWQNSEDMERLRGYEILAEMLRVKSQFINMTGFETLFEFLGLNFRSPDQSTVVNSVAYRAIALDFQLWSSTRKEIQLVHLEHFATLLQTSRHKRFNVKQRIAKMGVVRKMLFVLQTSWYQQDALPYLVEAIKVVAQAHFTADDAIKPIVSYLAANLHEAGTGAGSPRSVISRIDHGNAHVKAELLLTALVSILQSPPAFQRFTVALPLPRICLLLLGDRPSSTTAVQILRLLAISLSASSSFAKKFELASGWTILKIALPYAWDENVQRAAFNVLAGHVDEKTSAPQSVVCPQIAPAIFSSLKAGLETMVGPAVNGSLSDQEHTQIEANVEQLLEELIVMHSSSPNFRQLFKSQANTNAFVDAFKFFVVGISTYRELEHATIRVLEKLSHFALSLALDNAVVASQKQEIMDVLQSAETTLNPRASQETTIDAAAVVGAKGRRRRMLSVRLSVQLGEGTVKRSMARIHDWRKTVVSTERKRLRKTVLDLREHHRQMSMLTEWADLLTAERGLWVRDTRIRRWRLDETEGPYRVRKKLEPNNEKIVSSKVDSHSRIRDMQSPDACGKPLLHFEVPPWSDSYDISSSDAEDHHLEEEIVDDKHRRVRHELEPGDVIEAASTVARVSGVDSSPGLLIFGRTHIYMLDGLVENDDGEVIDAHDAPKRLFFVPGSTVELDGLQRAQRWSRDQVVSFCDRTFLFRDVGLELYFKDSRSLLIVFPEKAQRQAINERLASIVAAFSGTDSLTPGLLMSPFSPFSPQKSPMMSPFIGRLSAKVSATLSARVLSGFGLDELSTAQRKWQTREISNFTYLSILNQVSGRTPSDATQYPIFPWVLSDYSSEKLDLKAETSFRDLTHPMGALTPARQEAARSRYEALLSVEEKPFHYGTHFSSSMIVCHFLIRLEPFSHMFKTLQGGDWDLPDRLFSDLKRAYESAAVDVRGDVRELIPEFYACPEFLENSANLDFGVQQNTGERINDVKLPPWAKQDPLLFIILNRQALESNYVSEHLPQWIDLIWGYKQRDPDALNVFHPLSYEGSIDLESITDELEREATVGIIHNFGQTPRKIFTAPHPERMMHGNSDLPLGAIYGIAEDYHLLTQGTRVVRDLGPGCAVRELIFDLVSQRVIPCPDGMLYVPSRPHESIEWDSGLASGGQLKTLVDRRLVQVVEATFCSCAVFADQDTLITGSLDHTVRLWRVTRGSNNSGGYATQRQRESPFSLTPTHIMRAHTAAVICVAASRAWSLVVSGSADGSAALWDLNRGTYVRAIEHGPGAAVHAIAINENTGYIATCSRERLCLHTINARPIAALSLDITLASHIHPPVSSLAFLEREYSRVGVLATGAPDGAVTLRTWNTDQTPAGAKAEWRFATLRVLKVKNADGEVHPRGYAPCVTALRFVGETLYHGEDSGKVFSWDLPD